MALPFEAKAVREQIWLRGFNMGPTGSGKSKGALELAAALFDGALRTTLINSEEGRGKLYADRYEYQLIDLSADGVGADNVDFSPETWIEALDIAEAKNPGGVYILDSVSHEWAGKNGILQQADRFGEWKTVRPKHEAFVARIVACQAHVIVCARAKMKYEQVEEEVNGRKKYAVNMLGVGPIQDADLQYHFNLVGMFDQATHDVTWSGHADPLVGRVSNFATDAQEVAAELSKWLSEGQPVEPPAEATVEQIDELVASWRLERGDSDEATALIEDTLMKARRANRGKVHPDYVADQLAKSKDRLAKKAPQAA